MNIIPDSSVYFCRGVEINKQNQRDFNSTDEQFGYFNQRVVAQADRCYFIKTSGSQWSGSVKVAIPYQTLYNCDYLFYKNSGFLSKYFYAYIDSVEYIDTNTTRVNFTLDHYQTWVLDYEIKFAEVARQTVQSVSSYVRNDYIYPDVNVGGVYRQTSTQTVDLSDDLCILLYGQSINFVADMILQIDFQAQQGQYYPGVVFIYRMNDPDRYKKLEDDLYAYGATLKFDKCVIMPNIGGMFNSDKCWPAGTEVVKGIAQQGEVLKIQTTPVYATYSFNLNIPEEYKHDLKILHQPYIKYSLKSQSGDSLDNIDISLINNNQADTLEVTAVPLLWPNPMIVLYLNNYNGIQEINDTQLPDYLKFNRQAKLVLRDFPNVQTNEVDLSSIAQSLIGLQVGLVGNGAGLLSAALSSGYSSKLAPEEDYNSLERLDLNNPDLQLDDLISDVTNDMRMASRQTLLKSKNSRVQDKLSSPGVKRSGNLLVDILPNIQAQPMKQSQAGQQSLWQSTFRFTISLTQYTISNIDEAYEIFKMYGYQYISFFVDTKQRPYWNYIRTYSCVVTGDIPEEAKRYIEQMYNSGVTFWHDDDIYNYDRDNV